MNRAASTPAHQPSLRGTAGLSAGRPRLRSGAPTAPEVERSRHSRPKRPGCRRRARFRSMLWQIVGGNTAGAPWPVVGSRRLPCNHTWCALSDTSTGCSIRAHQSSCSVLERLLREAPASFVLNCPVDAMLQQLPKGRRPVAAMRLGTATSKRRTTGMDRLLLAVLFALFDFWALFVTASVLLREGRAWWPGGTLSGGRGACLLCRRGERHGGPGLQAPRL